jgi:molybdopterin converting factor subunit 1
MSPGLGKLFPAIMQVKVLFFGMLKDVAGCTQEPLSLGDGATVGDAARHYEERIPRMKEFSGSMAMSVNQEYSGPERLLKDGDEIGFLPPVSGGAEPMAEESRVLLVREKIDAQRILDRIKQPEDGAAVVFDGVVRNNTRGRRTLYLDYEAYEEMALKQLASSVEQARTQFKIRDAMIVHRLGRLEIGETSVLIVVASAHRAAAFEACRWLIDTLKKTVPIWKKEYFEDGAVWADGEAFPEEIKTSGHQSESGLASK